MDSILIVDLLKKRIPQFRYVCKKNKIYLKRRIYVLIILEISKENVVNISIAPWIKLFIGYCTLFLIKGLYETVGEIRNTLNKENIATQILHEM